MIAKEPGKAEILYPGDETLPDISNVTFDHADKNGNTIKFLWGVATSSYQVEGDVAGSANDWQVFTSSKAIRARVDVLARVAKMAVNLESPGRAIGHWDLDVFAQDMQRAKSLGINSYRLSLEWSRIQPKKPTSLDPNTPNNPADYNMAAILHYKKMLEIIVQNGMTPVMTLNHMTLPAWVLTPPTTEIPIDDDGFAGSLGGWESQNTVRSFVKFVQFVVPQFMDTVRLWITINEPVGSVMAAGYLAGIWSPGFIAAVDRAKKVLFNLVDAHAKAYDAIKRIAGSTAQVGFAHAMIFPKAMPGENLHHNTQAMIQYDYCFNRFFLEAVTDGIFNKEIMAENKNATIREDWKGRLDFVGINYYRSAYIYHNALLSAAIPWVGGIFDEDLSLQTHPHNLLNDLGWEVYPGGLYRFLKYLDERFHLPILITENGFAEATDLAAGKADGMRGPYIVAHLCQVLHAIKDGAKILGYIHWSIADNWEWAFDYAQNARFGLYTIDRGSGIEPLPRTMTQGAAVLKYIIGQGKIGDSQERFGTITPAGDKIIKPRPELI